MKNRPENEPKGLILEDSKGSLPEVLPGSAVKRTGNPLLDMGLELEAMPQNPDWPSDGAAQHDHYLYGADKQ